MGMYTECQAELVRALKAAGCEKEPFLSMKRMAASAESRISAVLCENDQVERTGGKKFYTSEEGKRRLRRKRYERDIVYTVVIGDFSQEKAEDTYEKFLLELKNGIYVDGNYVSINPSDSSWTAEKDHILYAKVAVQVKITCHGGLYQDADAGRVADVDIDVGKEGRYGKSIRNGCVSGGKVTGKAPGPHG